MYVNNDYKERFIKTYNKIIKSGLYNSIDNIFINAVSRSTGNSLNSENFFIPDSKFKIINYSLDITSETNTLDFLRLKSQQKDFKLLYLHSKGTSYHATSYLRANIQAWVDYMEYFVIERWRDCVDILDTYDTCGVDLHENPSYYSGNFWWANSSYIRKLPIVNKDKTTNQAILELQQKYPPHTFHRYYAEFWLLDNTSCKPYCLHHSGLPSLYDTPYTGYLSSL
jgi:hypothetical protein